MRLRLLICIPLLVLLAFCPEASAASDGLPTLYIQAHTGNDTLYVGLPGSILVSFEPTGYYYHTLRLMTLFRFSNGNITGSFSPPQQPAWSTMTESTFDVVESVQFGSPASPETSFVRLETDVGGWSIFGELYRYSFVPTAAGTIEADVSFVHPNPSYHTYFDAVPGPPSTQTYLPRITVVPCASGNLRGGDANFDRLVNSADVIHLVNHTFKSGPEPVIRNMGDVDCNLVITSSDIVLLVNYIFKSGALPCNPCSSVP